MSDIKRKLGGSKERVWATSEFQSLNRESVMETARPRAGAMKASLHDF